jgi:hypothetical protein
LRDFRGVIEVAHRCGAFRQQEAFAIKGQVGQNAGVANQHRPPIEAASAIVQYSFDVSPIGTRIFAGGVHDDYA